MTIDLVSGLPLEEPAVLLPWRTAIAAFPASLVGAREPAVAFGRDWIARVRVFGEGFRLRVNVGARDEAVELVLEPYPDLRQGVFQSDPPPAREQLAEHGAAVLRRRAQLVAALGAGSAVEPSREVAPCVPWRWSPAGGEVMHEVRWITERGLDDGWLDDRIVVQPRS